MDNPKYGHIKYNPYSEEDILKTLPTDGVIRTCEIAWRLHTINYNKYPNHKRIKKMLLKMAEKGHIQKYKEKSWIFNYGYGYLWSLNTILTSHTKTY